MTKFTSKHITVIAAAMHAERPTGKADLRDTATLAIINQHYLCCARLADTFGLSDNRSGSSRSVFLYECGAVDTHALQGCEIVLK